MAFIYYDEFSKQLDILYSEFVQVQLVVSSYEAHLLILSFFPRVIYALLAGVWSDRNGRKPIIFLPILGQVSE